MLQSCLLHCNSGFTHRPLPACSAQRTRNGSTHSCIHVSVLQALADGRAPSSVYGAEHLARLLSRLSDVMPLAQLSDEQLGHVAAMVQVGGWVEWWTAAWGGGVMGALGCQVCNPCMSLF
jgi:hypothetical protein